MARPTVAPAAPPRRRRRILFAAAAVLLVLVVAELAAACAWWAMTGSFFTWARADRARAEALAGGRAPVATRAADDAGEAAARAAVEHGPLPHPFLGFVHDPAPAARQGIHDWPVSALGFVDPQPVRPPDPACYRVALVGGSLALQVGLLAGDVLVRELQQCRALQGRRVELVRLALGGYRQPQQLLAVQHVLMLGGHIDCVVNLDGFNEVALAAANHEQGLPAWFPRGWGRLVGGDRQPAARLGVGRLAVLQDGRERAARAAAGWRWSATAQLLWLAADRRSTAAIAAARIAIERTAAGPAFRGPGAEPDAAAARAAMAGIWRRCSRDLQALCSAHGSDYFHFLQPNQYVPGGKPMGAAERAVAFTAAHPWRAAVEHGYPLLQAEAAALHRHGVRFADLSRLFAAHDEPLYVDDCCHLSRRGNELLAAHIAGVIRRRLDLGDAPLAALRVEPAQLLLDDPVRGGRLRVLGTDQHGAEHDVTAPAFGTRLEVPDGRLAATADGGIWPLQRGSCVLVVHHGGERLEVPVRAGWPDVFAAGDGLAAAGAPDGTAAPRLRALAPPAPAADGPDGAGRAADVTLLCEDLPVSGGLRLLVTSASPIPAALPADGFAARRLDIRPLPPAGDRVTATLPLPATALRDRPLFARVVVLSPAGEGVAAASNTLVLTRG